MTRHTRRNPSGPLLDNKKLEEVERKKRGLPAEKRWAQVLRDMGPINERNFERQYAYYKLLGNPKALKAEEARITHMLAHQGVDGGPTPRRRGGRTRRHTRRR